MDLSKAMFDYARINGECELVLAKSKSEIKHYIRVCYDKKFDLYKRALHSYCDTPKGLFVMEERRKTDLDWIIKNFSKVTKKTFEIENNQSLKNFILKNYHKYDSTGCNIFA